MNNKYIQQHSLKDIINNLKQNYSTYNISSLDNTGIDWLLDNLHVPLSKDKSISLNVNK